jgi:hypothetical protein
MYGYREKRPHPVLLLQLDACQRVNAAAFVSAAFSSESMTFVMSTFVGIILVAID